MNVFVIVLATLALLSQSEGLADKCGQEVESKVTDHLIRKYNGHPGSPNLFAMSNFFEAHDKDADGHVDVKDLESAFEEAGVSKDCIPFAKQSLEHMTKQHDHDDNGKIRHDELKEWRNPEL